MHERFIAKLVYNLITDKNFAHKFTRLLESRNYPMFKFWLKNSKLVNFLWILFHIERKLWVTKTLWLYAQQSTKWKSKHLFLCEPLHWNSLSWLKQVQSLSLLWPDVKKNFGKNIKFSFSTMYLSGFHSLSFSMSDLIFQVCWQKKSSKSFFALTRCRKNFA